MERLKGKTIGVLMGGLSSEREISLSTGNAVLKAIRMKGLNVLAMDVNHQIAEKLRIKKIDLAFIALHGTFGEDGTIQGVLEYLKIPYTGSGVLGSALAFNKATSKSIFRANKIPTPSYRLLRYSKNKQVELSPPLPVVVKPTNQGSSHGVTVVRESTQWHDALNVAFKYSKEIIVENFIEGKLLAIGMDGEHPMPIVHIIPQSGFYDYEAKYTLGKSDYYCPANLAKAETQKCNRVAAKVVQVLHARGFCRVDIILDSMNIPQVLELNTIPGLTPTSLLPQAAKQSGIDFGDLVLKMLNNAQLDHLN